MIHAQPPAIQQRNPQLTYCSSTVSGEAAAWFLLLSPEYPGEVSYLPTWFYAVWFWKVFKCWKFEFRLHVWSGRHMRWLHFALPPHSPPSFLVLHQCFQHCTCSECPVWDLKRTLWSRAGPGGLNDFILSRWKRKKMLDFCITNKDWGHVLRFPALCNISAFYLSYCCLSNRLRSPAGLLREVIFL